MLNQPNSSQRTILLSVALVALTLVAYHGVLAHAGWIWDDDVHVTANPTLTHPAGLLQIWFRPGATPQYYPLVFTNFWLQHHLWGNDARPYHSTNVLLHAASACLLWVILRRIKIPGGEVAAWLVAALFAVHPVQVESVAWITELKNVQSGFFYLAALWAYLNYANYDGAVDYQRRFVPAQGPRHRASVWYAATLLLFLAALLSKTVACSLPVAIGLIEWWKHGRLSRKTLVLLLPMLALGAVAGGFTAHLENVQIIAHRAAQDEWDIALLERCLIASRALVFYAVKLIYPMGLTFSYPRWAMDRHALDQWAYIVGVTGVLATLLTFSRKIGRGPFAAVAFFVVTLVPALGFFNVYPMRYTFVADHYQYLACIGLLLLPAVGLARVLTLLEDSDRWIGRLALAPILAALAILTFRQGRIYDDQETLWRDTIAKNDASWLAHENLAVELRKRAQHEPDVKARDAALQEAYDQLQKTLELRDEDTNAYCSLGQLYAERNDWESAADQYGHGLALDPNHVLLLVSYANLNNIRGEYKQAQQQTQHALELAPDNLLAHTALGTSLLAQGEVTRASEHYHRALELDPQNAWALNGWGALLIAQQKDAEAVPFLRQAVALEPRFAQAHSNLGLALRRSGIKSQVIEAVTHFRTAIQLYPNFLGARHNLAMTLVELGEMADAITEYRALIRLEAQPLQCGELAELLSTVEDPKLRNLAEAIDLATKACEMTENRDIVMLRLRGQILAEDERYDEAMASLRRAMSVAATQPHHEAQIEELDQQIEEYRKILWDKVNMK